MAVFVAGKGVLAVVQVQGVQPVQTNHPVKFRQYTVQVVHDVVAAVVDVTGVQTHAHVFASHGVQNVPEFLKPSADLAALPRHGFQQHRHRIVVAQGVFQGGGNVIDSRLRPLPHVTAGVEIVEISGKRRHSPQVVLQNPRGKGSGVRIGGAEIHGIRPVGDQFAKVIFFQHGGRFCRVRRVLRLGLAAPGIPGKKREGIRPDGQRGLHHRRVPAGCGKMTAKITQNNHSFLGIIAYSTGKSKFSLSPGSTDVL